MKDLIPVDRRLDEWLQKRKPEEFPKSDDYAARYRAVADSLREKHRDVVLGNLLSQLAADGALSWDQAICLNNHGRGHVEVVIDGAIVPPRQVYWKDLRPLGRGFPAELLGVGSNSNRQTSARR